MKSENQSILASVLALIVGIWVIASPIWIAMPYGAQVSTVIAGIVVVVASIIQMLVRSTAPSWINGAAAVWMFISMFVFGVDTGAIWSLALSALALLSLAIWDGAEIERTVEVESSSRHTMSPTM